MRDHLEELKERLREIHNVNKASQLLSWDRETYMPPAGAAARAEQMATLSKLAHRAFTAPETAELLEEAELDGTDFQFDSDDAALLRLTRRQYDRQSKLPTELVTELTRQRALAGPAWAAARRDDDFPAFAPFLETTVELTRQVAEHLGYEEQLYDALLDAYEPGMKTHEVQRAFEGLRAHLIPLAAAIAERADAVDDSFLHGSFDEGKQEEFSKRVVGEFGYDFTRGRLDRTVHPFATSFSRDDVRLTTRFDPSWLNQALFGTMHEAGHGMYEQGTAETLAGTALARGASSTLHESQSRMWENVVGRSRPFWEHYFPELQRTFPGAFSEVSVDQFYRAVNKVQPTYIRVEADEVTYPLHIMLRFDLEQRLLSGDLAPRDAAGVWNETFHEYFGITPPTDREGILQDMHWSGGMFGYFPTYALGTMLSVQLFDSAVLNDPAIPAQLQRGDFSGLHTWMTDRIYRHGSKYEPTVLIERATGTGLRPEPYLSYLKKKYGEIYAL